VRHTIRTCLSERVIKMNKFLSIILSIAMLFAALPIVFAADDAGALRLKNTSVEGTVFVAVYGSGNQLVSVKAAKAKMDGKDALVSIAENEIPSGEYTAKVYIPETNVLVIPEEESAAAPNPTAKPTQGPEETLHPAYESEAAAMQAFMVVKDVTAGLEDDMPVVVVTGYYKEREVSFTAEEGSMLNSVPDAHRELDGMEIADLQEGDVIYLRASLSGSLTGVDLIFRPMEGDIVAEETGYSFEALFTVNGLTAGRWAPLKFGANSDNRNQYAFGVVKERSSKNMLVLTNQAGKEEDDLYLGLTDSTIVYVYDKTSRNKLSIGAAGDIFPSVIPSDTKDEGGNIIKWNAEDEHHYALVRLYNGIATEIVVYMNY